MDQSDRLTSVVAAAYADKHPLYIEGGSSKAFLGGVLAEGGGRLSLSSHTGIVTYEPAELVVSVRAGTRLHDLNAILTQQGQMLGFEPPEFGESATIGGTIACGLSGPRRPYCGAARDFTLGVKMINGKGQALRFGGEVMKNVAGYDISRLMVGAFGTLGVLTEVSLKTLPKPELEESLRLECSPQQALDRMNHYAAKPLPISASCYDGEALYFRLSGSEKSLLTARRKIGGELVDDNNQFWQDIREHKHDFFKQEGALWRLSMADTTPPLSDLAGAQFIHWGGAERWLISDQPAEEIRTIVTRHGGHARIFRDHAGVYPKQAIFHPQPRPVRQLHERLKQAFDPENLFNRGKFANV